MTSAVGRLHVEAAVGPAVVVGDVPFQDVLGVTLSPNDDVVEAVPPECADHALGECVGLRSARRGQQDTRADATNAVSEVRAVDGVPVVDEKARGELGVSDGFDDALGGPNAGGMLGDAQVDDATAAKREDDEDVGRGTSRSPRRRSRTPRSGPNDCG